MHIPGRGVLPAGELPGPEAEQTGQRFPDLLGFSSPRLFFFPYKLVGGRGRNRAEDKLAAV